MPKKIVTITLGLVLLLQILLQSWVPAYAADEVLISSPRPGNQITGDYMLRYSVSNQIDPVEITVTYRDLNNAEAEVPVIPVPSSTGATSYVTKLTGLGAGPNTITVNVLTGAGLSYSDQREVTVHTELTNIVAAEHNVAPFVGDRNKFKNLLKANNTARTREKGLRAKNDSYVDRFVETLFEEAALENIRPDIVFAQMMLETGWLTYGYDVRENQNNFGGIGATGGGARGNLFLSMREGIRVNVQHLKAYASEDPLNGPLADPRFKYVTRGTAAWVEHLGYQENPDGFGWAMGYQYGFVIMDIIRRLDSASPEPFQVRSGPAEITDFEVGSITRGKWNDLDIKFITGFAPGQVIRLGTGTNSDSEHRFVIRNNTTGESITTPWSEDRAAYYTPQTAGQYQFTTEIRQKGTTTVLDSETLEVQIGEEEPAPDPEEGVEPVIGSVALSSSPYHPGKPISITISDASEETARVNEYQLEIEHESKTTVISSWSASRTYSYTPETTGSYLLRVSARNKLVGGEARQSITLNFMVESPHDPNRLIAGLSASSSKVYAGMAYAITITPVADPGRPVEYRLVQLNGDKIGLIGNWSEKTSFTYRPGIDGPVTLQAQARNTGGDGKILDTMDLSLDVMKQPGDMNVLGIPFATGRKITAEVSPFTGWEAYEYRLYLREGSKQTPLTQWQTSTKLEFTPAFSGRATLLAVPRNKVTGRELAPQQATISISRGTRQIDAPAGYIPENPWSVDVVSIHTAGVKAEGRELTFSARAAETDLLYRFYLVNSETGQRTLLRDWSSASFVQWKAVYGRYSVVAEVKHMDSRSYYDDRIEMPVRVKNYPTVYLDPGHGGTDTGYEVTSEGVTYRESDLTLAMAKEIQAQLQGRGINVVLSRSTDTDVTLDQRVGLAEEKSPDIYLTLHYTRSSNPSTEGVRTYYAGAKAEPLAGQYLEAGRQAAHYIGPATSQYYGTDRGISTETSVLGYSIRVLKETSMPALQLNLGYLTNDNDMVRIKSQWFRQKIAGAIAEQIIVSLDP